MRYTPLTEAQIQSMNVMDEGIYQFETVEVHVVDKFNNPMRDKNGNDMAKLKLVVWDNEGRERIVYTFISGDPNFGYKLRHYAQTVGMLTEYENGTFDIQRTEGKQGKANIVIKKGNLKNDGSGEMWPDRNDVKDFIFETQPRAAQPQAGSPPPGHPAALATDGQILDDDIPFSGAPNVQAQP